MLTKKILIKDLKNLGLAEGDLVMLHVSVRAIGKVLGGPDQILQAILDCISSSGTLTMFIGCPPDFEVEMDAESTAEGQLILKECPLFDFKNTHANRSFGLLADFFRTWPGTIFSSNPSVRFGAIGAKANWLVENHSLNYGYGRNSPLAKLYANNGKILFLGATRATILHYAEHISSLKKNSIVQYQMPLLKNNTRVWEPIEEFDTDDIICPWPENFFTQILDKYLANSFKSWNQVGNAKSCLVDAKSLVDFSIPIMYEYDKQFDSK